MKRPRPALLIALLAAAAVSAYAVFDDRTPDVVQPVARPASAATLHTAASAAPSRAAVPAADVSLRLAERPAPRAQGRDVFAAYSWIAEMAPPVASTPPPPPPPQAPPLPVVFGGMIETDGRPIFLLIEGDRTRRVGIGDALGSFVLQSAGPHELVFLHTPTGLTQTLPINGAPLALLH